MFTKIGANKGQYVCHERSFSLIARTGIEGEAKTNTRAINIDLPLAKRSRECAANLRYSEPFEVFV